MPTNQGFLAVPVDAVADLTPVELIAYLHGLRYAAAGTSISPLRRGINEHCPKEMRREVASRLVELGYAAEDGSICTMRSPASPKPKPHAPLDVPGPTNLDPEVWRVWLRYRMARKAPCTPLTISKQIAFLEAQPDPAGCIQNSITSGYQGLFPAKSSRSNGSTPSASATAYDEGMEVE
jgi:hypothetical protein